MIKKLITLISILTLINAFAVHAENDLSYEKSILTGLGIMVEGNVNHETFINSMAVFLTDNPEDTEAFARRTGILGAGDEYKGRGTMTLDEAVKYAVIALGYKDRAESYGGFPEGYRQVAASLGLTEGITESGNSKISNDSAVKLLYAMLEAEPMLTYYGSDGKIAGYAVQANKNLLEMNRKIYKVYGIVTANSNTSVYDESGTVNGYIMIDEDIYYSPDKSGEELIGRNVTAFVKENRYGENEIVYICERDKKNETVTIDAENIENVSSDNLEIEYINENRKISTWKLAPSFRVIFNGVHTGDYSDRDLMPETGQITLIDNNRDNKADVLIVKSYKTVVVESVDTKNGVIVNKYKFDGCLPGFDLEADKGTVEYMVYDGAGKETTLESVKAGSVLSVAISKNRTLAEIYISGGASFSGTVSSKNNSEEIVGVDGKEFKISTEFSEHLAYEGKELEIGKGYIFYTDYFGKISYFKSSLNKDYVLAVRIYADDDNEKFSMEYMDLDGEWYIAPLSDKLTFDGKAKTEAASVKTTLGKFNPQIMKLKFSANGEIREIDTAEESAEYIEDTFTRTTEARHVFRASPNAFSMRYYPMDDAKLVIIPDTYTTEREYYSVKDLKGYFVGDRIYTISAYDIDEYGFSSLFTFKDVLETGNLDSSMFVVTGFSETWVDDSVYSAVVGYSGEFKNMSLIGESEDIFKNLKAGDVINVGMNSSGRVSYVKKLASLKGEFVPFDISEYYVASSSVGGTVEDVDTEYNRIRINFGNRISSFRMNPAAPVLVYDAENNSCEKKTVSAIKKGDKVVCKVGYGSLREFVCLEE